MASRVFIKEKSIRRKIFLSVILIILGLSAFYNYNAITNNRQFKNKLIEIRAQESHKDFYRFFNYTTNEYTSKAKDLLNDPSFIDALLNRDTFLINSIFNRFAKSFNPDTKISITHISHNEAHTWGNSISNAEDLTFLPSNDSALNKLPFVSLKLSPDGYRYDIELNLRNENSGKLIINIINRKGYQNLENLGSKIIFNPYPQDNNSNQKPGEIIKTTHRFFYIVELGKFIDIKGNHTGMLVAAVDVTEYESPYRKSMIQSILVTLIVLLISIILLHLFFDRLVDSIFRLEKSFENEVIERTKEILDTNTELNQIFNSTANGIRIINKTFEIIRVNNSFLKICGLERRQIEGQKCYDIFPGSNCHTTNCPLEKIKVGEVNIESEEVRFNKGGKKIHCIHSSVPFFGKDGELLGVIEDFKDITEKYNVEATLKRTEKQFSSFLDNLPVGVFIKDTDGILRYQNAYMNTVFGFEKFIGKNISEELGKEWGERVKGEDEKTLQFGKIEFEESAIDKEGHERNFLTHKFRFKGADQKWHIGGISIDITSRKEAEYQQYVLSKAINNSPVCVVITNTTGEIEFTNPAFTRITGYSYDETLKKNLLSLKVEYNSGKSLIHAFESISKGDIWRGEVHMQNKNGDHFWVLGSFAPILNRKGEIAHFVAIMEDITLRKENEKELVLAKTRAEESDKLKTAFLSNLSHEIRTPLNAIIGFSSLLTDSDLTLVEKKNLSDVVYKNSNDLLKLIEDLIEISEIETGSLSIKKMECSVNAILNELQKSIIEEGKKANGVKISVRKEIHSDDFTILTDPVRLRQVLYNLLSNACKFTENGFVEFGYAFKDDQNLMFYVIDTGVGIEYEKQKHIFSAFRQADDSSTRKFGGMGLGLAISKHIVEKLGGKIWYTTMVGSGSTFYFTIPYIPIRLKFDPVQREEHKVVFNWKNKTILLADDIDVNYAFLKAAIKNTSAEVIWAKNGQEAVDMVMTNPSIDLVLMDIVMPDMDGFEATRKIKAFNNSLPVLCQTAFPSKEHYQAGLECGFDSYLAKPIKLQGILREIDKYFDSKEIQS